MKVKAEPDKVYIRDGQMKDYEKFLIRGQIAKLMKKA